MLFDQDGIRALTGPITISTGAGGSIGSELCRQISKIGPKKLILFEISETSLYAIDQELNNNDLEIEICPILGNVTDKERLLEVFKSFSVETVYHAAAYKQVPMVELNTIQSLENNIFGTLNCALTAQETNVKTFVLISTDKAVRPTNVMGASKRFAELIIQSLSKKNELQKEDQVKFTIVRFGNVLGSSSSVVPLFKEQIEKGGPVTVTDPEIVRYFMSIQEAAELVIQAGALSKGSEVFVLDMGEPIRIIDLAHQIILLAGLQPDKDIKIEFTGLRDGEKLFEEILHDSEKPEKTKYVGILLASPRTAPFEQLTKQIDGMVNAAQKGERTKIFSLIQKHVPEYKNSRSIPMETIAPKNLR